MNTVLAVGLFCFITIVAVPGNILVLLTFILKKRLHHTRYLLLASLALSDLLFQFSVNVFKIASLAHQDWIFGHSWCQISSIIADICYRSTMLHLCATTIEAYVPLIRPLNYKRKITRTKILWLVCLWVVPTVCSVAGWEFKVYNSSVFACQQAWDNDSLLNKVNVLITALVFFVIPLIIIASLQIKMWRIARKFAKTVLPLLNPTPSPRLQVHHGIPPALRVRRSDCRNTHFECERSSTSDSELTMNSLSHKMLHNLPQMPQQISNKSARSNSENENTFRRPGESMELNVDKDGLKHHDMDNRGYIDNSTFDMAPRSERPSLRHVKRGSVSSYRDLSSKRSISFEPKVESRLRNTKKDNTPNKYFCEKPAGSHTGFEMTGLDLQYSRQGSMKLLDDGSTSSNSDIYLHQEARSKDTLFNKGVVLSRSRPEQSISVVQESKVRTETNIQEFEREQVPNIRPCSKNRKLKRNSLQPIKSKELHQRPWIPGGGKHLSHHRGMKPSSWRHSYGKRTKATHVRSKPNVEEPDGDDISSGEFVPCNVWKTENDTKMRKCHIINAEIHFEVNTRRTFPSRVFKHSVVSTSNICNYGAYSNSNVLERHVDQVDFIKDDNTGIAETKQESIGGIGDYSGIAKTSKENNMLSSNCSDDVSSVDEVMEDFVIAESYSFNKHNDSVSYVHDRDVCKDKLDEYCDDIIEEKGDVQHVNDETKDKEKENVVNNTTTIKRRITDLRASRDIFIVTSVFILSFLPLWVDALYKNNHPMDHLPGDVQLICQWFAYASTFCNPIIYCIRKREFRRALTQLVRPIASRLLYSCQTTF